MQKKQLLTWLKEGHLSIPRLFFKHYQDLGLNETEAVLILQLYDFSQTGNDFPTPHELAQRMTVSSEQCSHMLKTLIQKGVLTLEQHHDEATNVYSESYAMDRLWERLLQLLFQEETETADAADQQEQNMFLIFEQEFGRPLSPIENETISLWLDDDQHSTALIKTALKEAVLAGKLNFRYIDRILLEWKKNNVQTVHEAKAYGEKFRSTQQRPSQSKSSTSHKQPFPNYNWLES